MSAIVAAIWVAGLALLWWRVEPAVLRLLGALAVHWNPAPVAPAVAPKAEPMPVELLMSLTDESEPWAREQQFTQAYELYARYGDWSRVMQAMSG